MCEYNVFMCYITCSTLAKNMLGFFFTKKSFSDVYAYRYLYSNISGIVHEKVTLVKFSYLSCRFNESMLKKLYYSCKI